MWSIYVPNLSEIDQSAAELFTINDRFFVLFRGCSNTAMDVLKTAWTDLRQIGGDIDTLSDHNYTPCLTRSLAIAKRPCDCYIILKSRLTLKPYTV